MSKTFKCVVCNKAYSHLKNLRAHVKQAHPDQLNEIAPLPQRRYTCDYCDKQYNSRQFLIEHERKIHETNYVRLVKMYNCPLCTGKNISKQSLIVHFQNDHGITLETDELVFKTRDEFNKWKDRIEHETSSKFVQRSGCKSKLATQLIYFECHRSGTFKSKSVGLRQLKSQGSKKIDGFCPATIVLTITKDLAKVRFTKTHVGHSHEVNHLLLSNIERNMLAEKISLDVPFDCILDEMRDLITTKQEISKLHTLTKADLHNIKLQYHLHSNINADDEDGPIEYIDNWVLNLEQHSSCVLLYKPTKALIIDLPDLKLDDFILVIMNDKQKEMLKLHSSTILIDTSHTVKQHNLEVITLFVLDKLHQGFPCAFLICNRYDQDVLQIFFRLIKDNFGNLSPDILMSDVCQQVYNAFSNVMGLPKKRLFCSWHVDAAWRKHLKNIRTKEKQIEIYLLLCKLLQETDVAVFETLLSNSTSKILLDADTITFGNYFIKTFCDNVELWAPCHVTDYSLRINMHLKSLHKALRSICFHGKHIDKLETMFSMLMNFIQTRFDDGLMSTHEEKITDKIKNIVEYHELSLKMEDVVIVIEENGWGVCSKSNSDIHFVQQSSENCNNCSLLCEKCKVCIHKYCCSCQDSSLKCNMCIHIHSVCQYLKLLPSDALPNVHTDSMVNTLNEANDLILLIPQDTQSIDIINDLMEDESSAQSVTEELLLPSLVKNANENTLLLSATSTTVQEESNCIILVDESIANDQSINLSSPILPQEQPDNNSDLNTTENILPDDNLPTELCMLNGEYIIFT